MERELKFRRATVNEAELISEIKTRAYRDEKERFKPEEGKIPKWFYSEWYIDIPENIRLINEYDVYLLLVEDVIIGTFWVIDIDIDTIELEDFCILPEYQGFGYGFKALSMMEELYTEKKKWELSTPFYSVRNQYLYEKFGYKKVDTRSEETVILYEKVV